MLGEGSGIVARWAQGKAWLFTIQSDEADVRRRGRALVSLCVVLGVGVALSGSPLVIWPHPEVSREAMFGLLLGGALGFGLSAELARRGWVGAAGGGMSLLTMAVVVAGVSQTDYFNEGVWFLAIPVLLASYAVRPRWIWALCALICAVLVGLYWKHTQLVGVTPEGSTLFLTVLFFMLVVTFISSVQQSVSQRLFVEAEEALQQQAQLRVEAEHSRAEAERARAAAEEARASAEVASQAKSSFLANMSHELRTPLNAIIGYSEILIEDIEEEESREDLSKIHTAGNHLLSLINDILDLSKIEAGRMAVYPERVELRSFLEELLASLRPMAARHEDELSLSVESELGVAYTDPVKLRQVLLNLLSNALKFTACGVVTLRASRGEGVLLLEVDDTGIGMEAEVLEKIFRPFVQADASTTRKYGGTGLGLSLTHKLLELLGGSVEVRSEVGVGSTFTVRLPVSYQRRGRVEGEEVGEDVFEQDAAATVSRSGGIAPRVLVVDDDEATRDYVARQLEREGFEVRSCGDGRRGLALARELKPALILLDILMPDVDGWELLAQLQQDEELAGTPVVLASILDERSAGMGAGAVDFLSKPIQRDRLILAIRRALGLGADGMSGVTAASILVVEDSEVGRDLLVRMVQSEPGWVARTAEHGARALAVLDDARPDLILLDLMMPEMDGFTFLKNLREHPQWRHVPVLVVTAKTLEPDEELVLRTDTQGVLMKGTLEREALVDRMRDALS